MNKYTLTGIVCGGIFAVVITGIAAFDAAAQGGLVLLSTAVAGLAAGLCIGGLIAANFFMLAAEKKQQTESIGHRDAVEFAA